MQPPWTAQTTGKRASSRALKQSMSFLSDSWKASRCAAGGGDRASLPAKTSSDMPAEKCLPVDEITSARVAPSSPSRRTASRMAGKNAGVIVFSRSGRFSRRWATPLSCESAKNSLAVVHGGGRWSDGQRRRFKTRDGMALAAATGRRRAGARHDCPRPRPRRAHRSLCARRRAASTRRGWRVVGYDQRGHGAKRRRARPARRRRRPPRRPGAASSTRCAPSIRAARWSCSATASAAWSRRASSPARLAPAAAWSRPVDALRAVLAGAGHGMTPLQKALLAVLGPLTPNLAVGNGLKPRWISRDPAVVAAYRPIRWCTTGSRRGWPASSSTAASSCARVAPRWTVPTLLLYAGADRCVAAGRQRRVRGGGAGGRGRRRANGRASSTRSSTNPSRPRCYRRFAEWLDTLIAFAVTRSPR